MHARGILVQSNTPTNDSLWDLTWLHVQSISPSLQPDIVADPKLETGRPPIEQGTSSEKSPGADVETRIESAAPADASRLDQGAEEN